MNQSFEFKLGIVFVGTALNSVATWILLHRVFANKNAEGVSLKTQQLLLLGNALVLVAYAAEMIIFPSVGYFDASSLAHIMYLMSGLFIILAIRCYEPVKSSYDASLENRMAQWKLLAICAIPSLVNIAVEEAYAGEYISVDQQTKWGIVWFPLQFGNCLNVIGLWYQASMHRHSSDSRTAISVYLILVGISQLPYLVMESPTSSISLVVRTMVLLKAGICASAFFPPSDPTLPQCSKLMPFAKCIVKGFGLALLTLFLIILVTIASGMSCRFLPLFAICCCFCHFHRSGGGGKNSVVLYRNGYTINNGSLVQFPETPSDEEGGCTDPLHSFSDIINKRMGGTNVPFVLVDKREQAYTSATEQEDKMEAASSAVLGSCEDDVTVDPLGSSGQSQKEGGGNDASNLDLQPPESALNNEVSPGQQPVEVTAESEEQEQFLPKLMCCRLIKILAGTSAVLVILILSSIFIPEFRTTTAVIVVGQSLPWLYFGYFLLTRRHAIEQQQSPLKNANAPSYSLIENPDSRLATTNDFSTLLLTEENVSSVESAGRREGTYNAPEVETTAMARTTV